MENISPSKLQYSPGMPLFPVSPERINASKQPLPQSPSLPNFTAYGSHSPDASPTHRHKNSDVQGMVARFNALEIKDHQDLRRRDEAALKRAQMGREQAEEECRRMQEEMRALQNDLGESRMRERRATKRVDSVMDQLHSEKDKSASIQKTYEREIRRARKEAFKSSSALLETQKELKVTRAALNAAKVNLEKWVIPDGEELKARAEDVEMELGKTLRLVEHMKMECQFGVCACRLAELRGEVYVADADEQVFEIMRNLKPVVHEVVMDEEPPAYEEPAPQTSPMDDTPTPVAQGPVDEKHERRSASPRRSSTVQPPGEMMVFSPNSGTFRRAPQSDLQIATPRAEQHQRGSSHQFAVNGLTISNPSSNEDMNMVEEPKTPDTPATSVQGFSPRRDFIAASEDEQDDAETDDHFEDEKSTPKFQDERQYVDEEDPHILEDIEETIEEDEEPLESPTAHIRATTQITTIPLAPLSSPSKPSEQDDDHDQTQIHREPLAQPDFEAHDFEPHHYSRATTPVPEPNEDANEESRESHRQRAATPKIDTNLSSNSFVTPAPKSAPHDNILSATPWANTSTPLTRDEAIAMLRARRGRARSQTDEKRAPATAGNTPQRSASQGQALAKKGTMTPGRRDISTPKDATLRSWSNSGVKSFESVEKSKTFDCVRSVESVMSVKNVESIENIDIIEGLESVENTGRSTSPEESLPIM
ncbi:MAG: hypothetical protein Q9159_006255 [Coniocarpon cinnabarinum]